MLGKHHLSLKYLPRSYIEEKRLLKVDREGTEKRWRSMAMLSPFLAYQRVPFELLHIEGCVDVLENLRRLWGREMLREITKWPLFSVYR